MSDGGTIFEFVKYIILISMFSINTFGWQNLKMKGFSGVSIVSVDGSLVLFVLCRFFFWPLCCAFLDLRLLNDPLVSSNSSDQRMTKLLNVCDLIL